MFTTPNTCIPVDWFLNRIGLHPLLATGTKVTPCAVATTPSACIADELPSTFLNDIAIALNQVDDAIRIVTGISPCLKFESEVIDYKKYTLQQYARTNWKSKNFISPMRTFDGTDWKSVHLSRNHYIQSGVRGTTEIATDLPVVYLDLDDDGIREVAEITFTFAEEPDFDICELWGFFPNSNGDEKFRVVDIFIEREKVGLTVTLRYNSWNLFTPDALSNSVVNEAFGVAKPKLSICCTFLPDDTIDPLDTTCPLAKTLDLYRVFVDTVPCPVTMSFIGGCDCDNNSCVGLLEFACVQDTNVCNYVRLVPSEEDEQTGQCEAKTCRTNCCEPDKACVQYVGGCTGCLDIDCFDPDTLCFEDAVYWLTMAWMRFKPCTCSTILNDIDLAQEDSDEIEEDIDNPLYRTVVRRNLRGERQAWGLLKPFIQKQCNQSIPTGIAVLGGA